MSKPKIVEFDSAVQDKLLKGVNTLANAVGSTLGPMGRNVILEVDYGATTVTKDGVTVAKFVDLQDPVENLGAQILKQAAARTAALAGDGTTTATVIAQALVNESRKLIVSGVPPIEIKRAFENNLKKVLEIVRSVSKEVTPQKIQEIATISANNDSDIGALIASAYNHVGPNGMITLEESKTGETDVYMVEGAAFDRGYVSPYFITDPAKGQCVLENPLIFITDNKVRYAPDIVPLLELAVSQNRPLLIIADEIEGQALQLLAANKLRGVIKVCAIKSPSFGDNRAELLEDIAALTSAEVLTASSAQRMEDVRQDQLGSAAKVIISKNETIIIDSNRDPQRVAARAEAIAEKLASADMDTYLTKKAQERLARLTATIAIIRVGAATETELKEKKDRVDDALRATVCAVQKGYVVGGGTTLARASVEFSKGSLIDKVFAKALISPLRKIAENAGVAPDVIASAVIDSEDPNYGYNAATAMFEDLITSGVIDPTLVLEQAMINAVSAANMILLSNTAVYKIDRTEPYSPGSLEDYAHTS